jgi:hypothetical protein
VSRLKGCPIAPDFLLSPVGLTSFMRLSLMKAAHAVTDRAVHRKSGDLARFWRDVGDADVNLGCLNIR